VEWNDLEINTGWLRTGSAELGDFERENASIATGDVAEKGLPESVEEWLE
jgi:hypothetical protein